MKTMKNTMRLLALAALLMSANPVAVFADNETVTIGSVNAAGPNGTAVVGYDTNINNNKAASTSDANSTATGGNSTATGGDAKAVINYIEKTQLPVVSQYYPGMVNAQLGSDNYGSSVAMFSNYDILGNGCRVWTMAKHRVKIEAMRQVENSVSWDKMMDLTIAYPNVEKKFSSIGEGQVYLYDSIDLVRGMGLREEDFVGTVSYDTELSKKYFVPQSYLGERACYDGSQLFGANLTVRLGEFNNGHFIASGNSFSLGGIFSTVLNCVSGSGASAGLGGSGAKNSKVITNGAVYGLFHISGQPQVVVPVAQPVSYQPQPVERLEEVVKFCPYPCYNNASLRKQLADAQAKSGNFSEAIKNYEIAQRDILAGKEPSGKKTVTMQAGLELLKVVRYNELYSILKTAGETEEIIKAQAWGFKAMPESVNDLKN